MSDYAEGATSRDENDTADYRNHSLLAIEEVRTSWKKFYDHFSQVLDKEL